MKNIISKMNIPNYKNIFPEGNCYILNKIIAEYMFDNRFNIYKNLNIGNSFDYSWFKSYYNLPNDASYFDAFVKYRDENLFGNNLSTKLGWKALADGMLEHTFERIPFGICKLLNKGIHIIEYDKEENETLNNYIIKGVERHVKPIVVMACHTILN